MTTPPRRRPHPRISPIPALIALPITLALTACSHNQAAHENAMPHHAHHAVSPDLDRYLTDREAEFNTIPDQRKADLDQIADWIRREHNAGRTPSLTFVCTHNSRRSHMAQIWTQAAADAHNLNLRTYSGGTETTAFNPRAVAALERAGFRITTADNSPNPRYTVSWATPDTTNTTHRTVCFSKVYDHPTNPARNFAAVMVCDDADENCPTVPGAEQRFAITYTDPKASDNTPAEAATYDERCAQIAREMTWMITRATN